MGAGIGSAHLQRHGPSRPTTPNPWGEPGGDLLGEVTQGVSARRMDPYRLTGRVVRIREEAKRVTGTNALHPRRPLSECDAVDGGPEEGRPSRRKGASDRL